MNSELALQTESWRIERLIPNARNARTHSEAQVAQIAASIREFGFCNPVLVDSDGGIIAGHGRVLASRQLQYTRVPVIVLGHLSENQKRAYMLADNKLALNAGWDTDMLRLELEALAEQDFDLDVTGFDEKELRELIDAERQVLQDDAPAVQPTPVAESGDLWRMGDHRLLCGDGTHCEEVERVLEGAQCDLVFADLPYNVDYVGKNKKQMKIANDNLGDSFTDFLLAACRCMLRASRGPLYVCMSSSELLGSTPLSPKPAATGRPISSGPRTPSLWDALTINANTSRSCMAGRKTKSISGVAIEIRVMFGSLISRTPMTCIPP